MVNLTKLLAEVSAPTGLWAKIYNAIEGFVVNYGWSIILFTVFVKLIMVPLDFYNRYSSRKNNFIQKRLTGQIQKINTKFANNKERANREIQALYKREGYNMVGTCVFSLLNIVLTLFVFISFFNTIRNISAYKMVEQYTILDATYTECEAKNMSSEEISLVLNEKYDEITKNNHWLWVKNIWKNDSSVKSVTDYDSLMSATKSANDKKYYNTYFVETSEEYINPERYNLVMTPVIENHTGWNGYFIIAILAGLLSFASQIIADLSNKSKKAKQINVAPSQTEQQMNSTMKVMKLIMPAISIIFALTNPAGFGLYLLTSSIMSLITNYLLGLIVVKMTKKEEEKYLAYLEKEALHELKRQKNAKPTMTSYKGLMQKF